VTQMRPDFIGLQILDSGRPTHVPVLYQQVTTEHHPSFQNGGNTSSLEEYG